ncbi:UNVERIFIED_CONTAM: hypothetical protein K2H54_064911 [Gekko kuhli]
MIITFYLHQLRSKPVETKWERAQTKSLQKNPAPLLQVTNFFPKDSAAAEKTWASLHDLKMADELTPNDDDLSAETLQHRRNMKPIIHKLNEQAIRIRWVSPVELMVNHRDQKLFANDIPSGHKLLHSLNIDLELQDLPATPAESSQDLDAFHRWIQVKRGVK